MATFSPMMKQYFQIKEKHQEHILFYRLGDFYEMFFDDAKLASKELELTLTGRECGQDERAPMCGVPHHSCEAYIARLIKKGYKVAICEQVEDPKETKGIVKREVVRVITPGTLIEANMLDENVNNYIASIYVIGNTFGFAVGDISTGEVNLTQFEDANNQKIKNELARFSPTEIIFNEDFLSLKDMGDYIKDKIICSAEVLSDEEYAEVPLKELCKNAFTENECVGLFTKEDFYHATHALKGLFSYIKKTQINAPQRLNSLNIYSENKFMYLDVNARRNLELTQTMLAGEKKGSLLWVLDKSKTPMGKRLMRSFLENPLIDPTQINKRLNAVEEIHSSPILSDDLTVHLSGIYDLERLITRIVYAVSGPRELKALEYSVKKLPMLKDCIAQCKSAYIKDVFSRLDTLSDIAQLIEVSIKDEDLPVSVKDGGVIRKGYNEELDELRELSENAQGLLAKIEFDEKERTGIKTLKVGYNRVFGYYIDVSKSYTEQVPDYYIRKQTLSNNERYITPELKVLEEKILSAKENLLTLETKLFNEIKSAVAGNLNRVCATASAIAELDVYTSLAVVARMLNYTKPIVNTSDTILIKDGRHPVVEAVFPMPFVANDLYLNNKENQIAIITGPNMSGKSTYMRQTALIVLMAQIGSFVPAASAEIGIVDGIFTRVGASDDLASGQSTFMVEMSEVANILKHATYKSLLILDEIGRGTSTFDGMSIAKAVIEYLATHKKCAAKTMFATHYHELVDTEKHFSSIKNYHIAAKKKKDDIVFLRKIVPGGTDDSYGIEVSKLAGIPDWIIKRAYVILSELEQSKNTQVSRTIVENEEEKTQLSFSAQSSDKIAEYLNSIDVNTLTPIEALNKLYELKKLSE